MIKYHELVRRHDEERKNFKGDNFLTFALKQGEEIKKEIEKDITGENFIKDMFKYEMDNAEYHINQYKESVLWNISITLDEFEDSDTLKRGFELAEREYLKSMEKYFYL